MTRVYAPDFCLVPKIAEIGSLNGGKMGMQTNIVLNKIEKKKKEVVTKAENNYLSRE